MGQAKQFSKQSNEQSTSSRGVKNYPRGDSSHEAFISLPLMRAISSGIIRSAERLASSVAFRRFTTGITVFSLAFLCAFLTASIATPPQNSNADTIEADIDDGGFYANVTSSGIVDLDVIATTSGAKTIAKDDIVVKTNSDTGYKLYISTDSSSANGNRMYKSGDATKYLDPVNGISPTMSGTPTALSTNTWGYALASWTANGGSVTINSYFAKVPLLNSEDLLSESSSATSSSGDSLEVYYGVMATTALPAGTYASKVIYTVLAEGDRASGAELSVYPAQVPSLAGGQTITITTNLYTSQTDLGTVTVTIGDSACTDATTSRTSAGAVNITCNVPAQSYVGYQDVVVTFAKYDSTVYELEDGFLYYIPWAEMTEMQQMTDYACEQATIATSTDSADYDRSTNYAYQRILTDNRDGNAYIVRRLLDGNCWMTENLRLTFQNGYAVNVDDGSLTALTSHNSDFTTLTGWTLSTNTTISTTGTAWYSELTNPDNLPGSYSYGNQTSSDGDGVSQYKGTLYNWYTATAGVGLYSTTASTTIEDSICPYGWRLPVDGGTSTDKSWTKLLSSAGSTDDTSAWSTAVQRAPYSLIIATAINPKTGNPHVTGIGYFWTATAVDNVNAYHLHLSASAVRPQSGDAGKGWGFSVRCVSR